MERDIHSSLSILERIRSLSIADWRRRLVCDPDSIHSLFVDDVDISSLFCDNPTTNDGTVRALIVEYNRLHPATEEESRLRDEGIFQNETERQIATLDCLCEMFGNLRFRHGRIQDYRALSNGFILLETRTKDYKLRDKGIAVCDLSSDKDFLEFTANWDDSSDPDDERAFSWQSFLCHPLPPSNSAIIVDRYLFQSRKTNKNAYIWGVNNVVDLLKKIIPDCFKGNYYVTILFEQNQLGDGIETILNDINHLIRRNLSERLSANQFRLIISFVAVRDPKGETNAKIKAWKDLHNLIHDRSVFTNYYVIDASGSLNVSGKDERASRWQKVQYKAILSGVDNPYQKPNSIPIITEKKFLYKLFSSIKAAPSEAYQCYAYNFKEKRVTQCLEQSIENNLISFRSI